ncbi:MAG: 3-deoxy-D-manno-octulosonic acid transferase, partial [Opitutales bacterium]|nr:3-deoxy-D-manno-octulosonic acid transferase [Opitutales bacterium]
MIWIYRLLFLPLFLVSCPYYFGRMIKRGGYAKDFTHRFGCVPVLPPRKQGVHRLWIQAVSVGETEAVAPLLRELKNRDNVEVILTTTTSTAYKIIREKYADLVAAYACFPMDFLPFSSKAWKRFDPTLAVLMEGELWPEHLAQARARGVPVFVVNARLSDKSFRRYRAVGRLARWILGQIRFICAGTQNDYDRFRALGVPAEKIAFTGNMKFDVASGEKFTEEDAASLKKELGFPANAPVLLGSSTWPGEEAMLLETFAEARKSFPELRLLICPRHAERRAEIVELLEKTSWKWFLRSRTKPEDVPADADICIADTTGELRKLTHLAQL